MKQPFTLLIDPVGFCNLRCPSCPQGRHPLSTGPLLDRALFADVLDKLCGEAWITGVCLFNWTDSLLHPQLPELIAIAQRRRIPVRISTNLNSGDGFHRLLLNLPDSIIITVSGWSQDIYGRTHTGGNIETVKHHMVLLSHEIFYQDSNTEVRVAWLRYRHNAGDEEDAMREFARHWRFTFCPSNAFYMPVEDAINMRHTDTNDLISNLIEHPAAGVAARSHLRFSHCVLRENMLVLDSSGNVSLCCAVRDSGGIGRFIDLSLSEIQERRNRSTLCVTCQNRGGMAYIRQHDGSLKRRLIDFVFRQPALRRILPQMW